MISRQSEISEETKLLSHLFIIKLEMKSYGKWNSAEKINYYLWYWRQFKIFVRVRRSFCICFNYLFKVPFFFVNFLITKRLLCDVVKWNKTKCLFEKLKRKQFFDYLFFASASLSICPGTTCGSTLLRLGRRAGPGRRPWQRQHSLPQHSGTLSRWTMNVKSQSY